MAKGEYTKGDLEDQLLQIVRKMEEADIEVSDDLRRQADAILIARENRVPLNTRIAAGLLDGRDKEGAIVVDVTDDLVTLRDNLRESCAAYVRKLNPNAKEGTQATFKFEIVRTGDGRGEFDLMPRVIESGKYVPPAMPRA